MSATIETARLPAILEPLFQPARYKVLYGGRGGGKSWSIALYLLTVAAAKTTRVLCCREFQSSIRDSVHKLLADTILRYRLHDRFEIMNNMIRGPHGSEFLFEGLRHNVSRVRSLEGLDKVWVEEAQNVSKASWEILIPTIRKDGSEILLSMNPELETDYTYQRFVLHPPANAIVIRINYPDNPWFPSVLREEMEDLKQRDPDAYLHVWMGECRQALEGAIYAKELRDAVEEGRICSVPYDPTKPVSVYFDLGWSDATSIWFAQHIAGEVRLIDFHQDSQRPFMHYLLMLQNKGYVINTVWLPHDAAAKSLGTGRSIQELAHSAGWRTRIVAKLSVADGINATRTLFPRMWFDKERCSDGIQALRHYRYDVDPTTGIVSKLPFHDQHSHAADALRYVATAMEGMRPPKPEPKVFDVFNDADPFAPNTGWLGA